jgi:glycosyltransferase involved in cell wall biosynthesis
MQMSTKPIFSIISPTYNCQKFILKSYYCLTLQIEKNWEWIVVDDGSTDDSLKILKSINDPRLKIFTYSDNKGRGYARNYALEKVKGDIVVIWDIDDLYFPNRLSLIKSALIDNNYDFFCSYALVVDNSYNIKGARYFSKGIIFSKEFVHPTLAFHSKLLTTIKYGVNMKSGEDMGVIIHLTQKFKGFYCEQFLMLYLEEREINLKKTLDSNNNSFKTVKALIKGGILTLPLTARIKYHIKTQTKIIVLNLMHIAPRLYLRTVKYRYLESFDITQLNNEQLKFISEIKNKP